MPQRWPQLLYPTYRISAFICLQAGDNCYLDLYTTYYITLITSMLPRRRSLRAAKQGSPLGSRSPAPRRPGPPSLWPPPLPTHWPATN